MFLTMSWNIGSITIAAGLVLAPMTKVTDLPFRLLCRDLGACLAFTEMVNVNAVSRGNKAAGTVFQTVSEDRPLGIQLFGTRPDRFLMAAEAIAATLDSLDGVFLDVNLDCPDAKVIKQGAGAALLKRLTATGAIINMLATKQPLRVTAKMRLGSGDPLGTVKLAKAIEDAGASAISIHARTVQQKNSGDARWDIIKMIKESIAIPVIGNGGVHSPGDASKLLAYSRCDAAMIGTAAIYNPAIFSQFTSGHGWKEPTFQERLSWLQDYAAHASNHSCLNRSRFVQRARDFLRAVISDATINTILSTTGDETSIIAEFERIGTTDGGGS
jgi:tRNA-dihydrouridine synthase B